MTRWIFKILRTSEWQDAGTTDAFSGAPIDKTDGYIHFSTWAQLKETAKRHFASEQDIHILVFDAQIWDDCILKWEPSRGGELFPHLYAPLNVSKAEKYWLLSGPTRNYDEIESWLAND